MEEEKKELDWLTKTVIKGIEEYYKNTVEITKTVRVSKGDNCDCCGFKKYERYDRFFRSGCEYSGGRVWCALYGKRLELSDIFRNNSLMRITTLPENWTYCKCKECLEDTNNKSTSE